MSSLCDQSFLTDDSKFSSSLQKSNVIGDFSIPKVNLSTTSNKSKDNVKSSNIFCINILSTFNKMVSLPDLVVWNRIVLPIVLAQGSLTIQLRTHSLFLRRDSKFFTCYCVLTTRGYLVIYANELLCKGYAINLKRAKKLDMSCERVDSKNINDENFSNTCMISVKWKFGTLNINLKEDQVKLWRESLLLCFEENFKKINMDIEENNDKTQLLESTTKCIKNFDNIIEGHGSIKSTSGVVPFSVNKEDCFSAIESLQTERSSILHQELLTHGSQCPTEECKSPSDTISLKTDSNVQDEIVPEILNEDHKEENCVWTEVDGINNVLPSKLAKSNFYASLPVSFGHRQRFEGALRFAPRNAHYNAKYNRTPLLDWLNDVGADQRFRRAKQYFEMGVFEEESEAGSN